MGTERLDSTRVILAMQRSSEVYREDVIQAIAGLGSVSSDEAEHIVATAGEDESCYGLRRRDAFIDALFRTVDEFLDDDEGGFHQMTVYVAGSERGDAILEFWFHVSQPGREGGVWLRQMVVGIDEDRVYASIGGG